MQKKKTRISREACCNEWPYFCYEPCMPPPPPPEMPEVPLEYLIKAAEGLLEVKRASDAQLASFLRGLVALLNNQPDKTKQTKIKLTKTKSKTKPKPKSNK
jgi:hypothetical protein